VIFLFCFSGVSIVNVSIADVSLKPSLVFSIKPGLCVLGEDEIECQDQLRVKWKANSIYSLCLYQQANSQFLHCWPATQEGEYQFSFVGRENTAFELRDKQTQKTMATKVFKILSDHNTSRNRRRNPWSFF
jgi:Protein of unknown function (DUF3019)